MTIEQMGALKNIKRPVMPQSIVPGSGRYDYVAQGDNGRPIPAVGLYPTGEPRIGYGLGARLADASTFEQSGVLQIGLAIAIAYLGYIVYEGMREYRRR